jgi:hypothetical protein
MGQGVNGKRLASIREKRRSRHAAQALLLFQRDSLVAVDAESDVRSLPRRGPPAPTGPEGGGGVASPVHQRSATKLSRPTRGHLRRKRRGVSIRAVPKISLVCQENPDNDAAGLRGSERSKSNIAVYIGQCGSSALPAYHGVMVGLRCRSIVRASGRERPENPRCLFATATPVM